MDQFTASLFKGCKAGEKIPLAFKGILTQSTSCAAYPSMEAAPFCKCLQCRDMFLSAGQVLQVTDGE